MHYMGSKAGHAADIIKIATANRKPGQYFCEPFVGAGNVICRVDGPRIGNDLNWRMIALLDAVGNKGWLPPETMTEAEFKRILDDPDGHLPELVAFVATTAFGSVWMGPWVKGGMKYRQGRDAAMRDAPGLRGVKFVSMRYEDFGPYIPAESIVYCDPPYADASGYSNLSPRRNGAATTIEVGQDMTLNTWNRVAFWKWADALVDAGHDVFVSEYNGPPAHIYDGRTPELKAERDLLLGQAKITDKDPKAGNRETLRTQLAAVDRRIRDERERLASRGVVLWSKEVVSDFHSKPQAAFKKGHPQS